MAINMAEEFSYSLMVIDMKANMRMGNQREMECTIGTMGPYTKANSKMESGMATDNGSSPIKNMKAIM